jgi:phospholipid/cholesterol/gamma-HCH transport system permease protein
VRKGSVAVSEESETSFLWRAPLTGSYLQLASGWLLAICRAVHGLTAFALITLGVLVSKLGVARAVTGPLIRRQVARCGLRLLPMVLFLAAALGLVVIGQMVSLLTRVGANAYLGTVMVTVVVRELGPLATALIVLTRVGAANVVELGMARAQGEVEALEALGIDPIHYLVVPRSIGLAVAVFALSVYLILGALFSGYVWAFLQDVPILPGEYFRQLAAALTGLDFLLLALKTLLFGAAIAVVTCYHGLAQPLRLEQVSRATVRALAQSVVVCVALDAVFLVLYLVA